MPVSPISGRSSRFRHWPAALGLCAALATQATAAAELPGDAWIAGQRVRYQLQGGRPAAALAAARACRAAPWWCEALAGLAEHIGGDYAGAASAYRIALRDMPRDERCRWTDVSLLLDGELARRYRRLPCDQRGAFEERLWWLAQPLYSLPGNDRRTEHLARATMARIEQDARSTYGVPWSDDLREVTLRFGWPSYWTREERSALGGFADPPITGHEPQPAFHFLPDAHAFDDPGSSTGDDWALDPDYPRHARERYAPRYAAAVAPLTHQIAVFPRGDSCLVVAAYDLRLEPLFGGGDALDAALVLVRDEWSESVMERRPGAGPSDEIVAKAEGAPPLMSLEVVAATPRHIAPARYGVRPPAASEGGLSASDILLFDPPDSLPTDLAAVLPYVRGSAVARADSRLGMFWELRGLQPAEPVTTAVTVTPTSAGGLRRATASLGLVRRRAPVRLEWQGGPPLRGARARRALGLALAGLSPGRYRIEVVLRATGDRRASATREIVVEGR